jgi:signal transduction histidine kinase
MSPAFTLANEVRNPLTNINLSVEKLHSAITDTELRSYLDIILRGSAQIDLLINELLNVQDVEVIPVGYYSLHQLLDEALIMTMDRILLKKIRLNKEYATEDDRIFVDKLKVRLALANIMTNAVEAMAYNTGELSVITRSLGRKFAVEIADNGTVMGLGLSTTLEILQYNHIGVDVSSKEGQGTSFMLFIDVAG